jgi:hypothetical protein
VAYRYLGDQVLLYTQYRDLESGTSLSAAPGGAYDMAPVFLDLPVPPADGRWEPEDGDDSDSQDERKMPPVPLLTGSSTEGEDN